MHEPTDTRDKFQRICDVVDDIPEGCVASYGQVADLAGLPRGARLVSWAMRRSNKQHPWHRVINSQGRISFPKNSDMYQEQIARLAEEGIEVIKGRVDFDAFGWHPSLDELLWKPDAGWK